MTTLYPSGSSNVRPSSRQYGLNASTTLNPACRMAAAVRELEVEARASISEHDSVEALVIFETADLLETETALVHGHAEVEVANWACYAEVSAHSSDAAKDWRRLATPQSRPRRAWQGAQAILAIRDSRPPVE